MYANAKILNKIQANKIQQTLKLHQNWGNFVFGGRWEARGTMLDIVIKMVGLIQ